MFFIINFKKIIELSIRTRISIILTLSILLFLIGYFTCINPLKHKLHRVFYQQIELNKILEMQNNQLNKFLRDNTKFDKPDTSYEQIKQQLKKIVNIEFFISKLMDIAAANFINLSSIKPLPKFHKKLVIIYPLQITISASYQKLVHFADKLRDLPYFTVLQKIKITKSGNNSAILDMQALLEIYAAKL